MYYKTYNKNIFINALITAALLVVVRLMSLPAKVCAIFVCTSELSLLILFIFNLICGIPGVILMQKKIPHVAVITLVSIIETFWISYALVPILIPLGAMVWIVISAILMVLSYLFSNFLFNKWKAHFWQKLLVASGFIVLTIFIADRLVVSTGL